MALTVLRYVRPDELWWSSIEPPETLSCSFNDLRTLAFMRRY